MRCPDCGEDWVLHQCPRAARDRIADLEAQNAALREERDAALARAEEAESWGSRHQLKQWLDAALARVKVLEEALAQARAALAATEPKEGGQ